MSCIAIFSSSGVFEILRVLNTIVTTISAQVSEKLLQCDSRFGSRLLLCSHAEDQSKRKCRFASEFINEFKTRYETACRGGKVHWDVPALAQNQEFIIYSSNETFLRVLLRMSLRYVSVLKSRQTALDVLLAKPFWKFEWKTSDSERPQNPWQRQAWPISADETCRKLCIPTMFDKTQRCLRSTKTSNMRQLASVSTTKTSVPGIHVSGIGDGDDDDESVRRRRSHAGVEKFNEMQQRIWELEQSNEALNLALRLQTAARVKAENKLRLMRESFDVGCGSKFSFDHDTENDETRAGGEKNRIDY